MKFLNQSNMNLKSYGIIAVIVVVAVFIVIKMTKFEGTVTPTKLADGTVGPNAISLKSSFTNKKEA